eukprot:12894206-Prorocentrum_lima.AAC.1
MSAPATSGQEQGPSGEGEVVDSLEQGGASGEFEEDTQVRAAAEVLPVAVAVPQPEPAPEVAAAVEVS